ncbi:hypothetical protein FRC08_015210 [Ceratobasidium sp. 394]|nr:hypothetical protein FRC08_015210 [Ceratobasidium sp. 394]
MIIQSPVLELVAQLPCLECLVVYTIYPGAKWDPSRCQQLPPGSFPALESLTAELRSPHDAKRFWELIPLPNLKELELDMGPSTDDNELQFIPTLCRGSPQITSLQLRFRGLEEPHVISSEMFEHLACLPLKETFSLDSAILDFVGAWVRVASAWPHLKTIYCLDQPTNLDHLLLLCSNLPDLKYINCDLDLEDAAQTIECNWRPDGRPAFYSNLAGLTIKQFEVREAMQYNLTEVARFIAYFWPEAEVRSDQEDPLSDFDDNDSDTEREDLLDKQGLFRMFRELIRAYVCLFHDG